MASDDNARLRQSEAERVYLRDELERAEHTLMEYSRINIELRSELQSITAEAASLRRSLETERAMRRSLEESRSWRWTRPFRVWLSTDKRRA